MHAHAPGVRACVCAYHDEGVHVHRHPRARMVPRPYLKIQQLPLGPHVVQGARVPSLARVLRGIARNAQLLRTSSLLEPVRHIVESVAVISENERAQHPVPEHGTHAWARFACFSLAAPLPLRHHSPPSASQSPKASTTSLQPR